MKRHPSVHQFVIVVLDTLLIIGAMLSVMTIDRGRWLIANPAFYQPPAETQEIEVQIPKMAR